MSSLIACLFTMWLLLAVLLAVFADLLKNLDAVAIFLDRLADIMIKWQNR